MSQGPQGPKGSSGPDYIHIYDFIVAQGLWEFSGRSTDPVYITCAGLSPYDMILVSTRSTGSNHYTGSLPYVMDYGFEMNFALRTSHASDNNTYLWIVIRPPTSTPGRDYFGG